MSDAAYTVLNQRVGAHQESSYVFRDLDRGDNLAFPSGWFGVRSKMELRADCVDDITSPGGCTTSENRLDQVHGTVIQINVEPLTAGEFVGINFEEPESWGANRRGVGRDLRGATEVLFDVRSPTPGGVNFQFGVGERTAPFMHIAQSNTWTTKSISLSQLGLSSSDLANQHVLFSVGTNDMHAPNGATILIDNIRFNPVPTAQRLALGLPVSNETFGSLATNNPPFPLDQVVRNLSTIYESSITGMTLLNRGTPDDLRDAKLIADTFIYAMANDNAGLPLPKAPDGSVGLHSGYMGGGEIGLRNSQGAGRGEQGDVRLAGFSVTSDLCGTSKYCLVLDGATGGNVAFAMLFLERSFLAFDDLRYLNAARTLGRWIAGNLTDTSGTGYGGYYLGYPDEGREKTLLVGKSVENNADIFASMTLLAGIERSLGNLQDADLWTTSANIAGDFVMEMFDAATGRFFAGTVPAGQPPGPGIDPTGTPRGNDVINRADFLDSVSFVTLALAAAPRYRNAIDWRRPVQYMLDDDHFKQKISVGGKTFEGFNIVSEPTSDPGRPNEGLDGVAWAFTGQAVLTMKFVDALYAETRFASAANFYLGEIQRAQALAPFSHHGGIAAATLEDGDSIPPLGQCLPTPFQCIPERVGLEATVFAIAADRSLNLLDSSMPRNAVREDLVGRHPTGGWYVASSTGTSFVNKKWGNWAAVAWADVQVANVNGDGLSDMVGRHPNGGWYVAKSTGTSFVSEKWANWATVAWADVHVADVNGDGRSDIVGRHPNGTWYVAKSTGTSFVNEKWATWAKVDWLDVRVGDFDGDGRDDIAGRHPDGKWYVAKSTGTNFATGQWTGWATVNWADVRVGDFNGDGRDDIAGRHPNGGWYVARSNGAGFVNEKWTSWATVDWADVRVGDFNGDGSDDIAGRHPNGGWYVSASTGVSFGKEKWASWATVDWADVQVADANGDGRSDIVGRHPNGGWYVAKSTGIGFVNEKWTSWARVAWVDVNVGHFDESSEEEGYHVDTIEGRDYGDAPAPFATLAATNGARHLLCSPLLLGARVDSENNGQPNATATGDDVADTPDDEDGVTFTSVIQGRTSKVNVVVSAAGKLDAFLDFNADGDFADPGEKIFNSVIVVAGTNVLSFSVPSTAKISATYSRFRLSTGGGLSFTGLAADGEVEDYRIDIIQGRDYGDAPDSYATLAASNGARHLLGSPLFLANRVDSENNGQPNATATGDDVAGMPDDEGGVTFGSLIRGTLAPVTVSSSGVGKLDAFVDFNRDGDFGDPGEKVFNSVAVSAGSNSLQFAVPHTASTGNTFARFRVSTAGGLSFNGSAANGEVEDYLVTIPEPAIDITSVPTYATDGFISGVVQGVDFSTHRVATYIQIEGAGWWTKPTFASPTVPINADGTFTADVATGGIDDRATIFCAAIVPADVNPPQAAGAGRIPAELESLAIDCHERFGSTLEFAGRTWGIKEAPIGVGPGGNRFSSNTEDVFVDDQGRLHLTIHFRDESWQSTEVVLLDKLGYGTYSFQTDSRVDVLDSNVTFGAFTWDPYGDETSGASPAREIDFEDARWGNPGDSTNAQMVVQPFNVAGNLRRYTIPDLSGNPALTRFFTWEPEQIEFVALKGHHLPVDYSPSDVIDNYIYTTNPAVNHFVPTEGRESFRFNLWLIDNATQPANGASVEVIISDFNYFPLSQAAGVSQVMPSTAKGERADDITFVSHNLDYVQLPHTQQPRVSAPQRANSTNRNRFDVPPQYGIGATGLSPHISVQNSIGKLNPKANDACFHSANDIGLDHDTFGTVDKLNLSTEMIDRILFDWPTI